MLSTIPSSSASISIKFGFPFISVFGSEYVIEAFAESFVSRVLSSPFNPTAVFVLPLLLVSLKAFPASTMSKIPSLSLSKSK